jgi:hypothetical protein
MPKGESMKLRNGIEEASPFVVRVQKSLEDLLKDGQLTVLIDLVALCRDPAHGLFGPTARILIEKDLIEETNCFPGHKVRAYIRNIVLACVEGDGVDMRLVSPVAKEKS